MMEAPKTKRTKVRLACDNCRKRKIKCDGMQPRCQNCIQRDTKCVFARRPDIANEDYVKMLEKKVRELSGDSLARSTVELNRSTVMESNGAIDSSQSDATDSILSQHMTTLHNAKKTADAMGAVLDSDPQNSFYGVSSTVSFMQLVEAAVSQKRSDSARLDCACSGTTTYEYSMVNFSNSSEVVQGLKADELVLPPRQVADYYISCYFRFVYNLYPFLHEPSFQKIYQSLWVGNLPLTKDVILFYCVVNILFAFGCQLSPDQTPDSSSLADMYFQRSRKLLDFDIVDNGSLLLLQALLLTGLYLQSSDNPARCWNVVGLAIRVAQGLGLHKENEVICRRNYIEQQICRRLWYGCVMLDQILGMTFRRPLAISKPFTVRVPEFIDDEYITDSGLQVVPENAPPSRFLFVRETIKLNNMLEKILPQLYEQDIMTYLNENHMNSALLLKMILSLEEELAGFVNDIPHCLRFDSEEKRRLGEPFERQSYILQLRYLHTQVMLCRPALFSFISRSKTPSPLSHISLAIEKSVYNLGVEAALTTIQIVYDNRNTSNIPVWWYCIYFVHTAAIFLLTAKLIPGQDLPLSDLPMEDGWQNALAVLRQFQKHGPSAGTCLRVLQLVHNKISNLGHHNLGQSFESLPGTPGENSCNPFSPATNTLLSVLQDQLGSIPDERQEELLKLTEPIFNFSG